MKKLICRVTLRFTGLAYLLAVLFKARLASFFRLNGHLRRGTFGGLGCIGLGLLGLIGLVSLPSVAGETQSTTVNKTPAKQGITPLFWQLDYQGVTSYALGSIHLGKADMYPLSDTIMNAYHKSDALVVEVNMVAVPQAEIVRLTKHYGINEQRSLTSWLSDATEKRFWRYCQIKTIACQQFTRFEPWLVSLTFASMNFQQSGFDPALGIDLHFLKQAKGNKTIIELESMASQLKMFDDLIPEVQEELLVQAMNTSAENFTELLDIWKTGDEAALIGYFEQVENPALKKAFIQYMLVDRNKAMTATLMAKLAAKKSVFVVVGSAHLVGKDNMIQLLRQQGVTVKKMTYGQ